MAHFSNGLLSRRAFFGHAGWSMSILPNLSGQRQGFMFLAPNFLFALWLPVD
jgi:hypothetical protein